MTQPRVMPPARYNTLLMAWLSPCSPAVGMRCCAVSGAMMLNSRPQKLARPQPVPLIGAAKTSGVQPYRTALNMLWKKYSIMFRPMLDAWVLTALKMKMDAAIKPDETTIVHWRPIRGTPYMSEPMITPTMPGA